MSAPSYNYLARMLIGINIVVVEAKHILMDKLEAHLPQVVGQCIAMSVTIFFALRDIYNC